MYKFGKKKKIDYSCFTVNNFWCLLLQWTEYICDRDKQESFGKTSLGIWQIQLNIVFTLVWHFIDQTPNF